MVELSVMEEIKLSDRKEEKKYIWMCFVGKRLYGIERFVKEAVKLGVSRAIPPTMLKNFEFGDRIYLAVMEKQIEGLKKVQATIFGFYTIENLLLSCSEALKKEIYSDPRYKVVKIEDMNVTVNRICGSYTVTSTAFVDASLKEIAEVITEKSMQANEKVRIMLGGKFSPVEPLTIVTPFSRSPIRVECDESIIKPLSKMPNDFEKKVLHVDRYSKRTSISKEEADIILNMQMELKDFNGDG